jgi:hypothetical protein
MHTGAIIATEGNCYSESVPSSVQDATLNLTLSRILTEQHHAHLLIGAAEDVLWPARRVASKVAILAHRSSNAWDPAGTAKWENQTEYTMSYQADQFGLYLALAVHGACYPNPYRCTQAFCSGWLQYTNTVACLRMLLEPPPLRTMCDPMAQLAYNHHTEAHLRTHTHVTLDASTALQARWDPLRFHR